MQDMWVAQWLNACSQENAWQQTTATDAKEQRQWRTLNDSELRVVLFPDFGDQNLNLLLYLKNLANE